MAVPIKKTLHIAITLFKINDTSLSLIAVALGFDAASSKSLTS